MKSRSISTSDHYRARCHHRPYRKIDRIVACLSCITGTCGRLTVDVYGRATLNNSSLITRWVYECSPDWNMRRCIGGSTVDGSSRHLLNVDAVTQPSGYNSAERMGH